MEQTYQRLQRMFEGFFQSPDNTYVSRVHICAITPYNFMLPVFAFCSFKLATNDSVMSLLKPDGVVMWLKYEETRLCDDAYVFFRDSYSVVLVVDTENLCQSLILAAIKNTPHLRQSSN